MTSVKKISLKTKSKSNKMESTTYLNYFRKECYECRAPTKAQLILHELIPQTPLFGNYEKFIIAYLKSREIENYLKIEENLYKHIPK